MQSAYKRSEEFLDLEIRKEEKERAQSEMESLHDGQSSQMVVSIDQVEDMISKGWKLDAILPHGKAVCTQRGSRM